VTLTIKNARTVSDLDSHKLEFVAENADDITDHGVAVEAEGMIGQFLVAHLARCCEQARLR